jgi:uncharacterized membrane protein
MQNSPAHAIADQVTQPPKEAFDQYETTIAFWPLNERNPAYKEASSKVKNQTRAAEAARTKQSNSAEQQSIHTGLLIVMLLMAIALSMLFLAR